MSKYFNNYAAQKKFYSIYETLSATKQHEFGNKLRELADKKIISTNNEYSEFYVTVQDVEDLAKTL